MLLIQSNYIFLIYYIFINVNFFAVESIFVDVFEKNVMNEWIKFQISYDKKYDSSADGDNITRFKIFKQNFIKITEHNLKYEKGDEYFSMGVNKFSDQLHDEYLHETYCLKNDFVK